MNSKRSFFSGAADLRCGEDEDHAEPHFQCKAINAVRITSLQERRHKAHSSEVRSMGFAEYQDIT